MKKWQKEIEGILLDDEEEVLHKLEKTYQQSLKDVQAHAKQLQNDIDKLIADDPDNENQIRAKVYQLQYQQALEKQINGYMDVIKDKNTKDISDYLNTVYSDGFMTQQYALMNQGVNVIMPINQKMLVKSVTYKTEDIPLSTRIYKNVEKAKKTIVSEISRGLSTGMSNADISRNLKNAMGVSSRKAWQLAQNEGARVRQDAIIDVGNEAKKRGADVGKQWSATLDGETRPVHAELDGKWAELDEDFEYSGGTVSAPKKFGIASLDIGCRCSLLIVPRWDVEGSKSSLRRDNVTKEIVRVDNYQDWYNRYYANVDNTQSNSSNNISNVSYTSNFVPSNSVKEAEEYTRNELGIKNVSYGKNDLITINEWNRGLHDTFDRFPELRNKFGFVGDCRERNKAVKPVIEQYITDQYLKLNPNYTQVALQPYIDKDVKKYMQKLAVSKKTFAQSWTPTLKEVADYIGITVNSDFGNDSAKFINVLVANVKSGYHPIGCDTIRSVLDHEIGHQLDNLLDISNIKDIQDLYDSRTQDELSNALSRYAWDNSNPNKYGEMIAEGWAEYCNNPNPRAVAKKIGETIIKEYNKKYGGNP